MPHHEPSILVFEHTEFDIVDIHSIPWLRGWQVASALGYKNPSSDVSHLFERNADEFTDEMTRIVELDTAGGRQPVRIFSPRGCYLIGMLARTEKAKTFRQWVLDVLEGRQLPRAAGRMTVPQQLSALRYRGFLIKELAGTSKQGAAAELYANFRHVSRMLAMPVSDLEALAPGWRQTTLPALA